MYNYRVSLNSVEKVKDFVAVTSRLPMEMELASGRYVVDAKSIMGIFSLDLSRPIDLNIHAEGDAEEILTVLAPYIVES